MGLPDMRSKKKGKQQVSKEDHVAEILDKLREQTRETVKGLESISSKQQQPASDDDAMVEDFLKQFEDLAGSTVTKKHPRSIVFYQLSRFSRYRVLLFVFGLKIRLIFNVLICSYRGTNV